MATLVVNPVPEIFSQVPHLDEVIVDFREKGALQLIENVGQIFVKYSVYDKFALSMAHRHFEMTEKEILVECIKNDETLSVFLPWTISSDRYAEPGDKNLLTSYGVETEQGGFIVPQNWVFSSSGEAIPFEYLVTNDNSLLSQPPADFVKELYTSLKELGVERLVGLRSIQHMGNTSTWETTPDNIRANVVVHGDMPAGITLDKMVKVLWRFDENGKIQEGNASCWGCWCDHCNHCGSCTH